MTGKNKSKKKDKGPMPSMDLINSEIASALTSVLRESRDPELAGLIRGLERSSPNTQRPSNHEAVILKVLDTIQNPHSLSETELDTSDAEHRNQAGKLSSIMSAMSLEMEPPRAFGKLLSGSPAQPPTGNTRKRLLSSTQTPPIPKSRQRLMAPTGSTPSQSSLEPVSVSIAAPNNSPLRPLTRTDLTYSQILGRSQGQ